MFIREIRILTMKTKIVKDSLAGGQDDERRAINVSRSVVPVTWTADTASSRHALDTDMMIHHPSIHNNTHPVCPSTHQPLSYYTRGTSLTKRDIPSNLLTANLFSGEA